METLLTPNLRLRQYEPRDHEAVKEILADPEFVRNEGDLHVEDFLFQWREVLRIAELAESGDVAGMIAVVPRGYPEVSYAVRSEFRGRGYAKEMARAVTASLLSNSDVGVVQARVALDNPASVSVLRAAAFTQVEPPNVIRHNHTEKDLYLWLARKADMTP